MDDGMWSLVSELHPGRNTWGVKARVIRAFRHPKWGSPNVIEYFTVVLHDAVGTRIQAQVRISIYDNSPKKFIEGSVYKIKNFYVVDNNSKTKSTPHEFKIMIHKDTHITPYEKDDFPMIMHAPRDLEDIALQRNIDQSVLLDVIGLVVSYQPPCDVQAKETKRFDFKIEDENGIQIGCNLWGDYINPLWAVIEQEIEKLVIVCIQLGKISNYKEELKVANTFYYTKVTVNGDDEVFTQFKTRLGAREIAMAKQVMDEETNEIYQDFSSGKTMVQSIKSVNENKQKGIAYWIDVTIIDINTRKECWYLSCKECFHKVYVEGHIKKCLFCGVETFEDIYKYKLEVLVMDKTGCANLQLWNKQCVSLIGKSAAQVKEMHGAASNNIPKYVEEQVLDKRLLFEVVVTPNKSLKTLNHYTVGRLTNDEEIMEFFSKEYTDAQKDGQDSMQNECSKITSTYEDNSNAKDAKGKGKCLEYLSEPTLEEKETEKTSEEENTTHVANDNQDAVYTSKKKKMKLQKDK